MSCIPCGQNKAVAKALWSVDLSGTGKFFTDGSTTKTFTLASEAQAAISALGLAGVVRPTPQS